METATPSRSLKVTIKFKSDKNIINPFTTADTLKNAEKENGNTLNGPDPLNGLPNSSHGRIDINSTEWVQHPSTEDEENPPTENSQYQLVLYDPAVNGANSSENGPEPINHQHLFRRPHPFSDQSQRILPAIGAFTVQCANCFKWRLIPTKEKYEEIREHISERPFLCETAREWRPDVSCDDTPDITQDGSRLWAIDKPSIAQPPPGWQRLLRIRGEGSSKFADVYYVSPSGKRLRSMVEIQKYLYEHPKYMDEGANLSQFSFQIPKPLQENYVRKRPTRPAPLDDTIDYAMPGYLPPSQVKPITWINTDVDTDLQHLSGSLISNGYFESPGSNSKGQSAKKTKVKKRRYDVGLACDLNEVVNID